MPAGTVVVRTLLLACLLLGASGCVSSSSEGPALDPVGDEVTDPADFEAGLAPGSHTHNYWNGAPRVRVFDAASSLVYPGASSCPATFLPNPTNCQELVPLDDGIVPPGTRALDVSVEWPPAAVDFGQVDVYYEAPRAQGGFETGTLRLGNGERQEINVSTDTEDLPHTLQTRWRFWVHMATGTPGTVYDVHFVADAVRKDGDLVPAPPHPDPWRNGTVLVLNEYHGSFGELLGQSDAPGTSDHPGYDFSPNRSVPPLTRVVRAVVVLNISTPVQTAASPVLDWHGADRRDDEVTSMPPSDRSVDGTKLSWEWMIDVAPRMWDSPYAGSSNWSVFIDWHGGLGPLSATYTEGTADIRITAER